METALMLKVAGIGILVAVASMVLSKSGKDEQAMLVSLAGVVIVLLIIIGEIGGLFDTVKSIFGL